MEIRYRSCGHHAIVTMSDSKTHVIGEENVVDASVND
tara:strand:+ start:223 stop:333 length:111 start_codon:yes stop_codon:yes gene_type:complete